MWTRCPPVSIPVREFDVQVGDTVLSGLLSEPTHDHPHALILALHGAGMHAGYFDAPSEASLSLLRLGSQLGFAVWAPDLPGVGKSSELQGHRVSVHNQAQLLREALWSLLASRFSQTNVIVVAHSYGAEVALTLVARSRDMPILGVEAAGCGIAKPLPIRAARSPHLGGDLSGTVWGPRWLYPVATFHPTTLPTHANPAGHSEASSMWPQLVQDVASQITVPVHITYGAHETLWPIDRESRAALARLFSSTKTVDISILPRAGHNLSLGWTARAYHLQILSFAEQCLSASEFAFVRRRVT